MNIAIILAGGMGLRTFNNVPKQFLTVFDKPIIIYTLEKFQNHPEIDYIICPCLDGWQETLAAYAKQYKIPKLQMIVPGGATGHESINNALSAMKGEDSESDIIVIHDAIRPVVSPEIISECIFTAKKFGSGVAALDCQETIIRTNDGISGNVSIDRSEIKRVQTPQAYRYQKLLWAYAEGKKRGIKDSVYANTLFTEIGETVYFSLGSEKNFKITHNDDIEMFRAIVSMEQNGRKTE